MGVWVLPDGRLPLSRKRDISIHVCCGVSHFCCGVTTQGRGVCLFSSNALLSLLILLLSSIFAASFFEDSWIWSRFQRKKSTRGS